MQKKIVLFFILLLPLFAFAQQDDPVLISEERKSFQQNSMMVLGSWALLNFAGSGYMMSRTSGSDFRFHQMNVFWNVVNMGIAVGGYLGNTGNVSPEVSLFDNYQQYQNFGKILLFNAGLDVAYIATGFYLRERSKNVNKRMDMLKGYGQSLLLQGGFLLVFDTILYGMTHSRVQTILESSSIQISSTTNMLGLSVYF